jgi:hypothetical protein
METWRVYFKCGPFSTKAHRSMYWLMFVTTFLCTNITLVYLGKNCILALQCQAIHPPTQWMLMRECSTVPCRTWRVYFKHGLLITKTYWSKHWLTFDTNYWHIFVMLSAYWLLMYCYCAQYQPIVIPKVLCLVLFLFFLPLTYTPEIISAFKTKTKETPRFNQCVWDDSKFNLITWQ